MAKKTVKELNDEELIEELQKKLRKSGVIELEKYFDNPEIDLFFKEIYERYRSRIEAYCSRFIYDRDQLSDIYHDIFIKIYLNIHRYRYTRSFKAWIYKIAHNSCINYVRKHKRSDLAILNKPLQGKLGDDKEIIDLYESKLEAIEESVIKEELRESIDEAVNKLPYQNLNIYLLRTKGGLTFDEISKIEKVTSRSVKTLFKNALIFIKEELDKKNFKLTDIRS